MLITFSYRMVAAVAGAAIAVGMQALIPRTGAVTTAGHPAGVTVRPDAASAAGRTAAVRYWTPARMVAALRRADGRPAADQPAGRARQLARNAPARAAAPPAPAGPWLTGDTAGYGLRWTHGGAVAAAVGKIFFTLGGGGYVCSGTLVGGRHPDVVLTAAHCVADGPRAGRATQWAANWMFVPDFHDGLMPYGEYTARRFLVPPDWTGPDGGSEHYDVAFVQVTAVTLSGGTGAAQAPPGLPVEFTGSRARRRSSRTYVFGYPAEPPYAGLYLNYCAGPVTASGGSAAMPCGMTAGDSGGPWLSGFSSRSGSGPVVAVSTYKVSDDPRVLYGAVLGPQAQALYERAVSLAR